MTVLDPALPDAERLLVAFFLAQEEIVDAVDQRVFTVVPKVVPDDPFIKVSRVAGAPVVSRPLMLDQALIQIDSYGGRKVVAHDNAELVRRVIHARILGRHDLGVVTSFRFGSLSWLPDDAYPPGRPRYIVDVDLFVRPLTAGEQPGS